MIGVTRDVAGEGIRYGVTNGDVTRNGAASIRVTRRVAAVSVPVGMNAPQVIRVTVSQGVVRS
jgi:hypothetical protein